MSNKYTRKWDKENMHTIGVRFVNWQYDKIVDASNRIDLPVASFVRQAVMEKLAKMGIDINEKGEKKQE